MTLSIRHRRFTYLQKLKSDAEIPGREVNQAVITCPAYFTDAQPGNEDEEDSRSRSSQNYQRAYSTRLAYGSIRTMIRQYWCMTWEEVHSMFRFWRYIR